MRSAFRFLLLLNFPLLAMSSLPAQTAPGASGIKMTIRSASGETASEETLFIQPDRNRLEYRSALAAIHGDGTLDTRPKPLLAHIARCDLGQVIELNLEDREYTVAPHRKYELTKEQIEARKQTQQDNIVQKAAPWVPTVRLETTTVDTGERKNFFGHEARHIVSTNKTVPLPGSRLAPSDDVTDGWYIDLDINISCDDRWPQRNVSRRHGYYAVGGERYEVIDDGIRVMSFAIERKHSSRVIVAAADGTKRPTGYTWEEKITEFYEGPLDSTLFEIPGDFRKVSDLRREPPLTLADRWYLTSGWVKNFFK